MNDTHGIPNEEIKARPIALEIAREKIAQVEAEGRTIQAVDIWESLCAGLPLDADINVKRLLAWVRDQGVPIELADEGEDDDRGTGRTRRRTGAACRSGSRRRRRRPSSMRPGAFGTRRTDMAKKKAIKTEGEVEQALKLWIGRVLCEKAGLDEDQASEYVKEHAEDILEDLSDAIEAYEGTNPYEERISEDQEDEAVVDRPVILDPKEFS